MELLFSIHDKGAVSSTVALPFGVKPCKGSRRGFNAQDSFSHTLLWGRKGLDGGAEADSPAVWCLPPFEQLLWCVQLWWHSLAVTNLSLRWGWDAVWAHMGQPCLAQEELVVQNLLQGTAKSTWLCPSGVSGAPFCGQGAGRAVFSSQSDLKRFAIIKFP